jgi:hypothetical protein
MSKLDLKKQWKHLYEPTAKQFTVVDVPQFAFLMVDGVGDPNTSPAYRAAIEALYAMAYTLKFTSKFKLDIDYPVMALESLWWVPDMAIFLTLSKDQWHWTALIMQPPHITAEMVEQARQDVARKRNPPALPMFRLETFHEGLSAQIMYIGPYADEGPTIARLHEFIAAQGYAPHGKHHEIYLGDPRRTTPERLKTVIRQPLRRP